MPMPHDLSGHRRNDQMSSLQFRPFIPYQLVYGPSQKRLDVHFAATTPGTILWQYDPNDTVAQQFSFEDAGSGHVYIRTHTGSLYLTATPNGVIQDIKYPPGTNAARQELRRAALGLQLDRHRHHPAQQLRDLQRRLPRPRPAALRREQQLGRCCHPRQAHGHRPRRTRNPEPLAGHKFSDFDRHRERTLAAPWDCTAS